MGRAKTLKLRKKSPKKSISINGVKLFSHDPLMIFSKHKVIKTALVEALIQGDKEAFIEILSTYVRAHNILEVCRRTGLSRTVVYEAIGEGGNPSLDTIFKIMTAFRMAS